MASGGEGDLGEYAQLTGVRNPPITFKPPRVEVLLQDVRAVHPEQLLHEHGGAVDGFVARTHLRAVEDPEDLPGVYTENIREELPVELGGSEKGVGVRRSRDATEVTEVLLGVGNEPLLHLGCRLVDSQLHPVATQHFPPKRQVSCGSNTATGEYYDVGVQFEFPSEFG